MVLAACLPDRERREKHRRRRDAGAAQVIYVVSLLQGMRAHRGGGGVYDRDPSRGGRIPEGLKLAILESWLALVCGIVVVVLSGISEITIGTAVKTKFLVGLAGWK